MRRFAILFLPALTSFIAGCSTLSAEPVNSRVVDADTSQPIAGVVVVAFWDLHQGSLFGHAPSCGAANVEEAVTDADGRFRITGWGPLTSSCDMRGDSPYLFLFKPGYHLLGLNNIPNDSSATVSVSRSEWNGRTVSLHKFAGLDLTKDGARSFAWEFEGLNRTLGLFVFAPCYWKNIPNMLRAIYLQQQQLAAAGYEGDESITTKLMELDTPIQKAAPQCGSPKTFIEGLVQ